MASYFWREIFYVPFPGTPGKIPGNSGSTELRKEFGTTLQTSNVLNKQGKNQTNIRNNIYFIFEKQMFFLWKYQISI